MKVALACTCSTGYVLFLKVLLKSILINNPGKNYPFFVFHHMVGLIDGVHSLLPSDKDELNFIYPNLTFVSIDPELYIEQDKSIKYYSLEAFGLEGFDKVIYFGADMLNVKSLDEMVDFEGDLCMTKEVRRPRTYNNGGMIIGKKYLSHDLKNELIQYKQSWSATCFGTDQALIVQYFAGKITEAPQRFNTLVTEINELPIETVINLHYIIKPITHDFVNRCGVTLLDIWQDYQKRSVS